MEGLEAACWLPDLWTHTRNKQPAGAEEAMHEWMIEYMSNNLLIYRADLNALHLQSFTITMVIYPQISIWMPSKVLSN